MAFNLGEALKDVSKLGTGREQIEYIRLDLIDEDPNNFYQLSGIEDLAANIELCGLQQPIRVRPIPGQTERYMIVSGHRRRKALELLAKDDPERWAEVPCIVQREEVSEALQQLQLIYANSNTRTMTSAEISEQAVQVEKLLYQLKEEGYEFPGRMRDHVAKAVNASKSKLARLKVIRDNLAKCWQALYKKNNLSEDTAYKLAKLSAEQQQLIYDIRSKKGDAKNLYSSYVDTYADRFKAIDSLRCSKDGKQPCQNKERKCNEAVFMDRWGYFQCNKCCAKCSKLVSCRYACPKLADKIKEMRAQNKENRKNEQAKREAREKPTIDYICGIFERFGRAREAAGVSIETVCDAQERYFMPKYEQELKDLESGTGKITTSTQLPFGYSFDVYYARKLCATADLFGCSLDYLLCRTDVKEMAQAGAVSESGTGWRTGNPEAYGTYVAYVRLTGVSAPMLRELLWDGEEWFLFGEKIDADVTVQCWAERPDF